MSAKGTHLTDEQKARISAARKAVGNEKLKGRTRPPEVGQKISAAMTGKSRPDVSERCKGIAKSPETRAKISASLKDSEAARAAAEAMRVPARDGDVRQANNRIHTLVKRGRLPHPKTLPCTDCGQVWAPGLSRHEYDHYLGYGPDHHEDVQAVCSKCHHAREKARGRIRQLEYPCPVGDQHVPNDCKPCKAAHARRYRDAKKSAASSEHEEAA